MAGTGRAHAGQAAVEHLGLVLALALALAGLGAWVAGDLRPPEHPPDLVGAVARPLEGAPAAGRDLAGLSWAMRAEFVTGRGGRPVIGRVIRAIVDWELLNAEGEVVAGRSFLARVRQRLDQLLGDPAGTLRDVGSAGIEDPRRSLEEGWQDLLRYVGRLRRMPFREAFLTASRDAGTRAADAVLARLARTAARTAARRAARRPPAPKPAPRRRARRASPAPAPPPPAAGGKPADPAGPAGTPRARRRG